MNWLSVKLRVYVSSSDRQGAYLTRRVEMPHIAAGMKLKGVIDDDEECEVECLYWSPSESAVVTANIGRIDYLALAEGDKELVTAYRMEQLVRTTFANWQVEP